jgi:hypothetical protein
MDIVTLAGLGVALAFAGLVLVAFYRLGSVMVEIKNGMDRLSKDGNEFAAHLAALAKGEHSRMKDALPRILRPAEAKQPAPPQFAGQQFAGFGPNALRPLDDDDGRKVDARLRRPPHFAPAYPPQQHVATPPAVADYGLEDKAFAEPEPTAPTLCGLEQRINNIAITLKKHSEDDRLVIENLAKLSQIVAGLVQAKTTAPAGFDSFRKATQIEFDSIGNRLDDLVRQLRDVAGRVPPKAVPADSIQDAVAAA